MQSPIPPDVLESNAEDTTVDLPPDPAPPFWNWIIDRNPMFLISGVCMLAGCFMVSRHIHAIEPTDASQATVTRLLIGLLVVLNLYEFLVITLGLVLARTRTLVRDSRHLLGLALLLLVDASFIYNETGIFSLHAGIAIAAVAMVFAWCKAYLVLRSLRIRFSIPAMIVTAVSLAAMYALPTALRSMADDGFLHPPYAMALWCGLGLVVALHALPRRWVKLGPTTSADHRQLHQLVSAGLILLPLISLIGHAAAALWVYENTFEPSMLSPLLLGLAAIVLRHHESLGGARPTAQAASIIVASAVVASFVPGEGLVYVSDQYTWLAISPLRGVLLLAPLLLGWGWWICGKSLRGFINTLLPLTAGALGHSPSAMMQHLRWISDSTTLLGWGVIAIALSFLSLMLGSVLSWRRRTRERARAVVSELLAGPA